MTRRSLETLLQRALQMTRAVLGADAASVLEADDAGSRLVACTWIEAAERDATRRFETTDIPASSGVAGAVLAERRAVVMEDLVAVHSDIPVLHSRTMRSMVAVPLLCGDRVLGLMHLDSRRPAHFDAAAAELVEVVGEVLSAAMNRVGMFERERAARVRSEQVADRLARLQKVTAALSGDISSQEVAAGVLSELSSDLGPSIAVTTLWLADGDTLRLAFSPPGAVGAVPYATMRIDDLLPGPTAARDRSALWIESREELDTRFPELSGKEIDGKSFAVLPLTTDSDVLGVVAMSYLAPHTFDDPEKQFLGVVANQLAQALDRVRMRRSESRIIEQARVLSELTAAISGTLDYRDTIRAAVENVVPWLADMATLHLMDEAGNLTRAGIAHRDRSIQDRIRAADAYAGHDRRGIGRAAGHAEGGSEARGDPWSDPQAARGDQHRRVMDGVGIKATITVPLVTRTTTMGVLSLMRLIGSPAFDEGDRRLAEEVGRRIAVAVDNARLHMNRAEVARTLQSTLLPPELPHVPGADLAAEYHPAGDGIDVGGDFYDVFSLTDDRWVIMIGDVCGTGPAAAALTAQIRHGARVAARAGLRPAAVVPAINASLIDTIQSGRFCTMVYAEVVARAGGLDLQVICAGHPAPVVVRDGYAQELPVRGPLLGVVPDANFSALETTIAPGEVMVFVTDGAIEARGIELDARGSRPFFGQSRLGTVIEQNASAPALEVARAVARAVIGFGGGHLGDDLAVLVLKAVEQGR